MSPLLELELGIEKIDRAEVDLIVAGFFAGELPLRGAAGQADWRLCGLISLQIEALRLRGEPGEAVLVPSFGQLAAPHVLLLGLGERAHFGRDDVRSHTQDAVGRATGLGVGSIAMAPFGLSLRAVPSESREAAVSSASSPLAGAAPFLEVADDVVLSALDARRSEASALRMRLIIGSEEVSRVSLALVETAARLPEVTFEKSRGSARLPLPTGASASGAGYAGRPGS